MSDKLFVWREWGGLRCGGGLAFAGISMGGEEAEEEDEDEDKDEDKEEKVDRQHKTANNG